MRAVPVAAAKGRNLVLRKKTCSQCAGHGEVRVSQGFFSLRQTCPRCHGSGHIIERHCSTCHGRGLEQKTGKIHLKIPPGAEDGIRLKVSGEGEAGAGGGPRGNLYVSIRVKPHSFFEREGDDVIVHHPITFPEAVLGTETQVATLEGKVKLKIPAGTQPGKIFRLKEKGIANLRGYGKGDQLVVIQVVVPTRLGDEETKLLEQYAEMLKVPAGSGSKGFKKFFKS